MFVRLSYFWRASLAACAAQIAVGVSEARGATETVLYSFKGLPSDGAGPNAGLLFLGGRLYGTTPFGPGGSNCEGVGGCGTAFALTLDGVETILHIFGATNDDGSVPTPGLVEAGGAIYGTTQIGSTSSCQVKFGCGTVFKLTPAGVESVLYGFHWFSGPEHHDGSTPLEGVTKIGNTLYGTTPSGGLSSSAKGCSAPVYGCGAVFRLTLTGQESLPYSFHDGETRPSGLTALNAVLYGTTTSGGLTGNGSIFSVTQTGIEKTLYSFQGGSDGSVPGQLINVGGVLFGTTLNGGSHGLGTVFSITPSGGYRLLYSFAGGNDGANPNCLLYAGGTLYGTTHAGGAQNDGTVFRISKSGAETVQYAFQGGSDGVFPNWLINVHGTLYGTTQEGGPANTGTVFQFKP